MHTRQSLSSATPAEARNVFAQQRYESATNGCCDGYLQANVVILEKRHASDFLRFCTLNSRPAPLLEMLSPGNPYTSILAHKADIRSVLPKYRIHSRDGSFKEVLDINEHWNESMVTFLLGCSFSFEKALVDGGIGMRHIELGRNVPMFDTDIQTNNVKGFGRHMVVSMRTIKKSQIRAAYKITEPLRNAHGSPVHFGHPERIGIRDINEPEYGDAVPIGKGELPVFWACGVTTQVAVRNALEKGIVEQVITHAPGHMFISDLTVQESRKLKLVGSSNAKL